MVFSALFGILGAVASPSESLEMRDRSPIAVAVAADGRRCVVANYTSGSVALVDLVHSKVIAEQPCGAGPSDLVWVDDKTVLVCLQSEDSVAFLRIEGDHISITKELSVGDEPIAIAILRSKDNASNSPQAFVALSGQAQVAVLDLEQQLVQYRIDIGQPVSSIKISPNGKWLVTACSIPGSIFVHDTVTYHEISRRALLDETGNVGLLAILPDSSACLVPHIVNRTFPVNAENIEKGWVIDNRLSKLPLPAGKEWNQAQLGLDKRGDAVGDAYAAAVSSNGKWLLVTASGTHELLIFRYQEIPWPPADPGDFIPDELLQDDERFRRLKLGGRPLGLQFINPDTAIVTNYLLNALQIIDVSEAKIIRTIHLNKPFEPNLERRGEAIFYDADRSLNSWFSCHTCHPGGHTSGLTFDTLNDGSYNTQKLTPSLRGVTHTAPWTWHGGQMDLQAAVRKSLVSTMQGRRPPTNGDTRALVAFLSTLDHFQSPHIAADGHLTPDALRGKTVFEGPGGCIKCHQKPYFTARGTFDVGLVSGRADYQEFNPPQLRGLYSRRRFLHDGRARSLQEVLVQHHRPENVGGEAIDDQQLKDLIAYLNTL